MSETFLSPLDASTEAVVFPSNAVEIVPADACAEVTARVRGKMNGKLHKKGSSEEQPSGAEADVRQLWEKYKANMGNDSLRNRLVEMYLPLVKYNGERLWARLPEGVELDDLQSAGVFGLIDAIEAFDLSRGVKFETYCVPRIRGAMLDELRAMDWVPRLVRSKASKLNEAIKNLDIRLGRQPSESELAEELGKSVAELEQMISDASAVNLISLNKKWYETDSYKDVREVDILADTRGEDPEEPVIANDAMRALLAPLTVRERIIMLMYYVAGETMKRIGEQHVCGADGEPLSESRVSQMHSNIIGKVIPKFLEGHRGMDDYLDGIREERERLLRRKGDLRQKKKKAINREKRKTA